MRNVLILLVFFCTPFLALASGSSLVGVYEIYEASNESECPGVELSVRWSDRLNGLALYGATGMGANGPFANEFYFTEINEGDVIENNGMYISTTYTNSTGTAIYNEWSYAKNGVIVLTTLTSFQVIGRDAILSYDVLYDSPENDLWVYGPLLCKYQKNRN